MMSILRLVLILYCSSCCLVCYSSLDCHGNVLNVVLPEKAGASAFTSECCSAAVRGLSYQNQQDRGPGCQNCFSESYQVICMIPASCMLWMKCMHIELSLKEWIQPLIWPRYPQVAIFVPKPIDPEFKFQCAASR